MTNQEYINNGGNKCPCCGSKNISTQDQIQVDSDNTWQEVYCNDCEAIWNDIWKLAGYEITRNRLK